jgi:UPF0755 protein
MKLNHKQKYLAPAGTCVLIILGILWYYFFSSFSTKDETKFLYIDNDDTIDSVYAKLEPWASTHSMCALRTLVRHSSYDENIKSGRYAIDPDLSTFKLFRHLKSGNQTPVKVTIPSVRTLDKLAGEVSKKLMLDSASLYEALTNEVICQKLGYDTATIAAMFIPNTYEVYWNITLDGLMERMQKEHDRFWNGERCAKATSIGLTPNDVCTVASIIDEETANNDEKPMIAGMYLNRLKEGMPLQADPTIKFAMKRFELKRIYHDMLFYDSPYNTYRNVGLPPGPIKIASVKGIDAVLNRVNHDYLYMCAKEDFSGTHNFAKTYNEHLKNAANYSKALNERGIK